MRTSWANTCELGIKITWQCWNCKRKETVDQTCIGFKFSEPFYMIYYFPYGWSMCPSGSGLNVGAICPECLRTNEERYKDWDKYWEEIDSKTGGEG